MIAMVPPVPIRKLVDEPAGDLSDDNNSVSFNSSLATDLNWSTSSSSEAAFSGPVVRAALCYFSSAALADAIRRAKSGAPTGRSLSMADLRFLHRLGSGDIGSVYLVELKSSPGCLFAAKVMDKKELEGRNKEGRARTERQILESLDHPFLPRLYAAIDNLHCSCLLTEFCPGGDLHVLRQRQAGKRFSEAAARFYAAEVVVALEYVHMLGIVYRDLKPENVLIRCDGHIMLADFDLSLKCEEAASPAPFVAETGPSSDAARSGGAPAFRASACILPSCIVPTVSCFHRGRRRRRKKAIGRHTVPEFVAEPIDARSMSFVGTHEYLAPEIVSGTGHGSPVDWWTLGVFVFELLYGFTPFRGVDNEQTLANIVARALEFPKEPPISGAARDFIAALLVKDPAERLGSVMGAAAAKHHPFFQGVNWALLRSMAPPHTPPPFNPRDMSDDSSPGSPVDYF